MDDEPMSPTAETMWRTDVMTAQQIIDSLWLELGDDDPDFETLSRTREILDQYRRGEWRR